MNIKISDYAKAIFAIIITWYFIYCLRSLENSHIVTIVNLIIHEAGHSILFFFGQFIQVLGGSLFQVFVPLIFAIYFLIQEDIYSSGIILLWVGESVIEVSRYAGDAILMQLPLLGGDNVIHDWNWLLFNTNLLQHTALVASIIFTVGVLIMIGGFMTAFVSIVKK